MERISSEFGVIVTRKNQSTVYSDAFSAANAVFATGGCGVGKSTYAFGYFLRAQRMPVVAIVPSGTSTTGFTVKIRKIAGRVHTGKKLSAISADKFVRSYVGGVHRDFSGKLVVVDDAHSSDPAIMACVQLVRQRAPKYLLISASDSGSDAGSELAHVTITTLHKPSIGFDHISEVGISGTSYDSTTWPAAFSSVAVYPVVGWLRDVMVQEFKKAKFDVQYAPHVRRSTRKTAVIVMPGTDDGLTLDVDYLFDSGYTVARRYDSSTGVSCVMPVRCSRVEQRQRWARVGRQYCAGKVHYAFESSPHDIGGLDHQTAAILMRAMGLDVGLVMRRYGIDIGHYDECLAAGVVIKNKTDLALNYARAACLVRPILYRGLASSVPAIGISMDAGSKNYIYVPELLGNSLTWAKAKTMYYRDRSKYRQALVALAYGGRASGTRLTNGIEYIIRNVDRTGISLDDSDRAFLKKHSDYECTEGRRFNYYRSSFTADRLYAYSSRDYAGGTPQKRFAEVVTAIHRMPVVDLADYRTVAANKSVLRLIAPSVNMRGGANLRTVHSSEFRAALQWATSHGMPVCLREIVPRSPAPEHGSLRGIKAAVANLRADYVGTTRATMLVCAVQRSTGTGLSIEFGTDTKHDIVCAGYSTMSCADLGYADDIDVVVHYEGAKYRTALIGHRLPSAVKRATIESGHARLVHRTISEKIFAIHRDYGPTIMFVATDEEGVREGEFATVREALRAYKRAARRLPKANLEPVMAVYINESSDGDISIDGMKFTFQSARMLKMTDEYNVAVSVDFDVERTDGTVTIHDCLYYDDTMGQLPGRLPAGDHAKLDKPVSASSLLSAVSGVSDNMVGGFGNRHISSSEESSLDGVVESGDELLMGSNDSADSVLEVVIPPNPTLLRGGEDDTLNDDVEISLTEEQLTAMPDVQAGGLFSKQEKKAVHAAILGKYKEASIYIGILEYLIITNASENISDTDKFTIGTATFSIVEIFSVIKNALPDKERFTVRRFARSFAVQWLPLWLKAKRFEAMRADKNSVLRRRAELPNSIDLIYTCNFMSAVVPSNLRAKIAEINSTTAIIGDQVHRGDVNTAESVNVAANVGRPETSFATRGGPSTPRR